MHILYGDHRAKYKSEQSQDQQWFQHHPHKIEPRLGILDLKLLDRKNPNEMPVPVEFLKVLFDTKWFRRNYFKRFLRCHFINAIKAG